MLFIDQEHLYPGGNNVLYPNGMNSSYEDIFRNIYNSFCNFYDNAISYFFNDNVDAINRRYAVDGIPYLMIPEGIFCTLNHIDPHKDILKAAIYKNIRIFLYEDKDDNCELGGIFKSPYLVDDNSVEDGERSRYLSKNMISIFINKNKLKSKYCGYDYIEAFLYTLIMKYLDIKLTELAGMKFTMPGVISIEDSGSSYYIYYLYIKTFMMMILSVTNNNADYICDIVKNGLLYNPNDTLTFDSWHVDSLLTEMSLITDSTYNKNAKSKFDNVFKNIYKYAKTNDFELDSELLKICAELYDLLQDNISKEGSTNKQQLYDILQAKESTNKQEE